MNINIKPNATDELVLLNGIKAIGEKAKEFWRQGVIGKLKSSQYDIVTEADTEIEKDIKKLIIDKFPEAKIIGEESGGDMGSDYWTIDPIDGTAPFTAGLPTWSIAIGHVENNEFTFSMIYVPIGIDGPELYYSKKEAGAYMNGKKINVSQKTQLKDANLFLRSTEIREDEDGALRSLIKGSRMLWVSGSTSLALSYLAAGKLDVVIAKNQSIWDCPGMLLVTEAGGKVTLSNNERAGLNKSAGKNILATNGNLHDTVLQHLT